jgi:uncharacterized RDD family membrane protein YckC
VARLIDTLINSAIVMGIGSYIAGSFDGMMAWERTSSPLYSFADSLADFILLLVLHGYLLARYGQTVGKWLCGIRVVRTNRSKVGLWRILALRELPFVVLAATPVFYILPVLTIVDALLIFRASRQCLHDQIADTIVINV